MQRKFKLGALAWGIAAALMAFPANGAAADNNSAVCNLLATGNVYASNQCRQENTVTSTQTATATGGNGGTATAGQAGPSQAVGEGAQGSSSGGSAYANGGSAEASNTSETEQSNQISGRDSSGSGGEGVSGNNNSDVCKQLAGLNAQGNDQCHQSNTVTNDQTATATGGNGGSATGGNGGPVQVVGDGAQGSSRGGDAYANGGDAEATNSAETEQSNQISGRDSSGSEYSGEGRNNSAVCNLLATGNIWAENQCRQDNTVTSTQTATATGGNGGTATGGNGGPVQVVGDGAEGSSYGGDAYANGGDAEASNSLETEQSNQISGRDSGSGYEELLGNNNSAVCNQLATLDAQGNDQCHQSNTVTSSQATTATGGNGGEATGGNAAPFQTVYESTEDGSTYSSFGGSAYANGGDAESFSSLENEQSSQISGRDSHGTKSKKSKKSKKAKQARKAKVRFAK